MSSPITVTSVTLWPIFNSLPPIKAPISVNSKGLLVLAPPSKDTVILSDPSQYKNYIDNYQDIHNCELARKDFAEKAFKHVGLNYKDFIKIDKKLIRPSEGNTLLADYSKAKKKLKWKPSISFNQLVTDMVESDLEQVKKYDY